MVEADAYCVDILHQVAAVRAALSGVGRLLLSGHVEQCVTDAVRAGSRGLQNRKLAELREVLSRLNGG